MFESLRFRYFGPVDGHDVIRMKKVMEDLKNIPGPKILHCLTMKGKGYKFSEEGNQTIWHSPGLFDKETGEIIKVKTDQPQPPKYQDVFGHTIVELAKENPKIPSNMLHALTSVKPSQLMDKKLWDFKNLDMNREGVDEVDCIGATGDRPFDLV